MIWHVKNDPRWIAGASLWDGDVCVANNMRVSVAAFIAAACNSHSALLARLTELVAAVEELDEDSPADALIIALFDSKTTIAKAAAVPSRAES